MKPISIIFLALLPALTSAQEKKVRFEGEVLDEATSQPTPARVYLRGEDGKWHFVKSASPNGSSIVYDKENWINHNSVERHVTLSAHPFVIELPPGKYTMSIERGKEYLPWSGPLSLGEEPLVRKKFSLKRWIDMAARGWYSGDTHVHRPAEELANLQLAEDLNVAFPLSYWVRDAFKSPAAEKGRPAVPIEAKVVSIDATHVYYPLNTEYEIFTVNKKSHTLGAVFVLNQKKALDLGAPPVRPVAELAHGEGALLELDKHNWPWSMMIVPAMNVDLFELSNNHVWRTEFGFWTFGEAEAPWMQIEKSEAGFTEWGWIDFGFQNYYLLLNCGFRMRPAAGTASGVHPVPLGFGRVYVHLPGGFSYEKWMDGLNRGRSFVTTGPMLFAQVNGQDPGATFKSGEGEPREFSLSVTALSAEPLHRLELVLNGEVRPLPAPNSKTAAGVYENRVEQEILLERSSWLAVRGIEKWPDGRIRFAHTAPFHVEIAGQPQAPRRREVEYLIERVEKELRRHDGVLPEAALAEYRQALEKYREMATMARP